MNFKCELCVIDHQHFVLTYVAQPIGSNRKTNCLGSDSRREYLRRHNPVDASDAESKIGDVGPYKERSSPPSRLIASPAVLVDSIKSSNNELGNPHPDSTDEEDFLPPPSVHEHDGGDGGEEVDDTDNASCQQIYGVA